MSRQGRKARAAPRGSRPPLDGLEKLVERMLARIKTEYELDPRGELLLAAAQEAHRRWMQARRQVDREGLTSKGPRGPKAHPAVAVETRCRESLIRILAQLHLEGDDG